MSEQLIYKPIKLERIEYLTDWLNWRKQKTVLQKLFELEFFMVPEFIK